MKTFMLIAAAILSLNLAAETSGGTERYVVGISPFLQREEKDEVFRRLTAFLLESAPLNSGFWLYDAYHIRTIAQVDIPDVRAFRSSKTRANQFKEQIGALRAFLAAENVLPQVDGLTFDRALRLPQFMDFVADNLVSTNVHVSVILLGSPLYMDAKEPSFSMAGGAFPSDGHLLASREQSVYGLKTRGDILKDVEVHFGWFGDPWVSEVHREKIGRFWTLYLEGQGARLATFCGDLPTTFNSVRGRPSLLARDQRYELDRASTKVEMLRISREVDTGDWITRDVVLNAASTPPSTTTGPMKIGIRWKGNIDLDLYATPREGGETLFFEHTRIPEGYYFKDHRSSPQREYEFIEFEKPVDVWQVQASINFFEGRVPDAPSGEIRIEFSGRIYTGAFAISARRGNEGRNGPGQQDHWFQINIPQLLKLRDRPVAGSR